MASENYNRYSKANEPTEYSSGIVYGSLAYDLNALPKRQQEEQAKEKERVRTRIYETAKPQKQGISLFAIVGFMLFAVIMVCVLVAKIQLTQISDETAKLETKISELSETEARLKIEYESAFNLTEIEEYAVKKLGMVRQSSENHTFLETTDVDKAVILEQESVQDSGIFTGLKNFFASILEYF